MKIECNYRKFVGCPCCSSEYDHEQLTVNAVSEHESLCGYSDGWDNSHELRIWLD